VFGLTDWYRDGTLAEYAALEARNLAPLPGDVDFTVGRGYARVALCRSIEAKCVFNRLIANAISAPCKVDNGPPL
jgi:hypothetical protein